MSDLRPEPSRKVSSGPNDPASFHSLKQSLSASTFFRNERKSRSSSPQKDRNVSPSKTLQPTTSHEQGRMLRPDSPGPLNIDIPKMPHASEAALTALKYLPTPILVLSTLKTVVLANEAMGRLLGLESADKLEEVDTNEKFSDDELPTVDMLRGQSLSQLGIDMVQDGQQIWVSWDKFLDSLAIDLDNKKHQSRRGADENHHHTSGNGNTNPKSASPSASHKQSNMTSRPLIRQKSKSVVNDIVVNVMVNSQYLDSGSISSAKSTKSSGSDVHIAAKMIVSVWMLDNQRFFTLSFTSTYASSGAPRSTPSRPSSRTANLTPSTRSNPSSPGSPAYCANCGALPSPAILSPGSTNQNTPLSPFLPMGPPGKVDATAAPAILHKLSKMKDAIINTMDIPLIAMWRDESISIPNKAAAKLMHKQYDPTSEGAYDTLSRFKVYDENFKEELKQEEQPIVKLCRTQQPFNSWKIGVVRANGEKSTWEASGDGIHDERTGEFLGGIVSLKDVTKYDEMLKTQSDENDQQFQLICETMPQMLWTTDPAGAHDWFSKRWYDYTGQTVEESLGEGWAQPFHPEDMPATSEKWAHSLATGEEYSTEYRCRSKEGEWRWFLGRALPLRDPKTGQITKWFGSCTDIHELVEARRQAKETRERLLNVLKLANTCVWAINADGVITFLEGRLIWEIEERNELAKKDVGVSIFDIFEKYKHQDTAGSMAAYRKAIQTTLSGEMGEQDVEHYMKERKAWARTRFIPKYNDGKVIGLIGVTIDVTEMKEQDLEIEKQKKERTRLQTAESAAKEASKLKSQFLANMSHEIRTPIAGVIGMSELILDTDLDSEQKECAENIQRSANALLTVINDILDLSKVESGRLDIEEVQFSLGVVVKDVCKMLSFAAERKNLNFQADVQIGHEDDLVVLGDPGRVRQILTNLLTNSIKFTAEGYVRLAVKQKSDGEDTVSVAFTVQDSGIGIEEGVRERLFKPFSQADSSTARRFGGTGLGLTICKNLVELMHGKITLESELGHGTKATFWIPFNKPSFSGGEGSVELDAIPGRLQSDLSVSGCTSDFRGTPPMSPIPGSSSTFNRPKKEVCGSRSLASAVAPPATKVDRSKIHVLVVEDNAINQQIAIKTVRKFGFSVYAVWNGREALNYLSAAPTPEKPKPDIILMDVQMPILDGYRATHIIRHHSPYSLDPYLRNLPIIAMTASAIQGDKEKCQKAGMDDYLAKPVKGKALESMLLKWCGQAGADAKMRHEESEHDETCADASQTPQLSRHPTREEDGMHGSTSSRKGSGNEMIADESAPHRLPPSFRFSTSQDSSHGTNSTQTTTTSSSSSLPLPPPSRGEESQLGGASGGAEDLPIDPNSNTAAEMASALRDDKLLAASEVGMFAQNISMSPPPIPPQGMGAPAPQPMQKLTVANLAGLEEETRRGGVANRTGGGTGGGMVGYLDVVGGAGGVGGGESSGEGEGRRRTGNSPGKAQRKMPGMPGAGGDIADHSRGDSLAAQHGTEGGQRDSMEVERESTVGELGGLADVERGVRGWLRRKESDRSQVTVRPDDFVGMNKRRNGGQAGGGNNAGDVDGFSERDEEDLEEVNSPGS